MTGILCGILGGAILLAMIGLVVMVAALTVTSTVGVGEATNPDPLFEACGLGVNSNPEKCGGRQ